MRTIFIFAFGLTLLIRLSHGQIYDIGPFITELVKLNTKLEIANQKYDQQIAALEVKYRSVESDLETTKGAVAALQEENRLLKSDLLAAQQNISVLHGKGEAIQVDFNSLNAKVIDLENGNDALKSSLSDLQLKVKFLQQKERVENSRNGGQDVNVTRIPTIERKQICPENIGPGSTCHWEEFFGCYCYTSSFNKTWDEANELCRSFGMELVSLETDEEMKKVRQLLQTKLGDPTERSTDKTTVRFWTSGSNDGVQDKWRWTATGLPFNFSVPELGTEYALILGYKFNRKWIGYGLNKEYNAGAFCEGTPPSTAERVHRLELVADKMLSIGHHSISQWQSHSPQLLDLPKVCSVLRQEGSWSCHRVRVLNEDNCYCFGNTNVGRSEANNRCESEGMKLVSIETKEELDRLGELIRSLKQYDRLGQHVCTVGRPG